MILQLSAFLFIFVYPGTAQAGTPSIDRCPGTIFRRVASSDTTVSVTWDEPDCGTNSQSTHSQGFEFGHGVHTVVYWFASGSMSNQNERCCSFDIVVSGPDFDLCSQNVCKGGEVCVPEIDRYYCYPGGTNIKIRNCSKTVIVRKTEPDSVTAQWVEPTAFDHFGQQLKPSGLPQTSPGTPVPLGEHDVTYTFADRGQTATCSLRVIVAENTGPGFQNCPQDITVISSESAVRVYWLEPILQTNEDRNLVSLTQTHSPGQYFLVPSDVTVTYTFRDTLSGRSNDCSFMVSTGAPEGTAGTLVPPTVAKFVSILQSSPNQNAEAWLRPYYYRFQNTHTTPLIVIPSRVQPDIRPESTSNHIYPKGFYPVTYTFTDVDGNIVETLDFIIAYYNNDPDSALMLRRCSGNNRIEVSSEVPTTVSWDVPSVEGDELDLVWTEEPNLKPNQDTFPLGETVLEYMFYSPGGVETPFQCSYTVSITDGTPPQFLYCPSSDITKTASSGEVLQIDFPDSLSALDGSDGIIKEIFPSPGSPVSLLAGRSQVITYTASDIYGNREICSFAIRVTVQDPPPVEITNCLNRTHVTANDMIQLDTSEYPLAVRESGVTIARASLIPDFFTVNTETIVLAIFPSVTVPFIGDTMCTFTVLVLDDNPPVINNCFQEVTVPAIKCEKVVRVNWTEPVSVDSLEGGKLVTRTNAPLENFPVGETTVVWYIFKDDAGLQTNCSVNITVGKASFEECSTESFEPEDDSEEFSFTSETIVVIVVTAVATFVFSLAIFLMSLCCCTCCCVVDTSKPSTGNNRSSDANQRTRLFVKIGGKNIPIYGPVTPLSTTNDATEERQSDDDEFDSDTGGATSNRAYQNEAPKLPSVSDTVYSNDPSNTAPGNSYIEHSPASRVTDDRMQNVPYANDNTTGNTRVPPPRPPRLGNRTNALNLMGRKEMLEMQAAVQNIREEREWRGPVIDDRDLYGFDQPANM